jgi:hypothetical protein
MKKITLTKPFKLQNGKEISELQLNFSELSVSDLRQARKLESQISDATEIDLSSMLKIKAVSFEFQLSTGFLAAVKGTDGLLISDFLKIPMQDALAIAEVSGFFWLRVD